MEQGLAFDDLISGAEVKMDSKGRILVPKAVKTRLGSSFVVARGQVGSVALYPKTTWESLLALVQSVSPHHPARRTMERMLVGGARNATLDSADRLLVPPEFRSFAKLKDKVILVGLTDMVEVWSSEEFEQYQADPFGYRRERQEALAEAFGAVGAGK